MQPAPVPNGHTQFKVRVFLGVDAGEGLGGGVITVEIQDPDGHSAYYTLFGGGVTGGAPFGVDGPSDWTEFTTTQPMDAHGFGGWGGLGSAGGAIGFGGAASRVYFRCGDLPTQVADGIGWTSGMNLSASWYHGWWELID